MTINIIPFYSSVSPKGLEDEINEKLRREGIRILSRDAFLIQKREPLYIFIGTGGTENDVAAFVRDAKLGEPITILSYDERNSLPAAMEIRAYLEKQGIEANIIHEPLDKLCALLDRWSKYSKISDKISQSKIGLIGVPSSWLIASDVNGKLVKKRWGLELRNISINRLTEKLPEKITDDFHEYIRDFQSNCQTQSVSDDDILKAGIVAERMSKMATENNLNAVTVQCFSLLEETGISGCYSLSLLNDRNDIVAGCEGDIPATFTMLLAKLLTETPSFMANVASVDLDLNTAVFAHCTIPTSITEEYEITDHFETGLSVGIRGKLPLTDVTVFKVFGEDLSKYWVSSGTIIDNLVNDRGCRTQIRVAMSEPVDYFLEESLANHHIVILGDYTEKIIEFFNFIEHVH